MDLMLQMPLSFVHRLRDMRIKQLNQEREKLNKTKNMLNNIPNPNQQGPQPISAEELFPADPGMDEEDIVDELTGF